MSAASDESQIVAHSHLRQRVKMAKYPTQGILGGKAALFLAITLDAGYKAIIGDTISVITHSWDEKVSILYL